MPCSAVQAVDDPCCAICNSCGLATVCVSLVRLGQLCCDEKTWQRYVQTSLQLLRQRYRNLMGTGEHWPTALRVHQVSILQEKSLHVKLQLWQCLRHVHYSCPRLFLIVGQMDCLTLVQPTLLNDMRIGTFCLFAHSSTANCRTPLCQACRAVVPSAVGGAAWLGCVFCGSARHELSKDEPRCTQHPTGSVFGLFKLMRRAKASSKSDLHL